MTPEQRLPAQSLRAPTIDSRPAGKLERTLQCKNLSQKYYFHFTFSDDDLRIMIFILFLNLKVAVASVMNALRQDGLLLASILFCMLKQGPTFSGHRQFVKHGDAVYTDRQNMRNEK